MPATPSAIARIAIDRDVCIGAASCVAVAPEAFRLDHNNKSTITPGHRVSDEALLAAAQACPVAAIALYRHDGQRIYPLSA